MTDEETTKLKEAINAMHDENKALMADKVLRLLLQRADRS